ncbi:MAG: response regulator [Pseudolabrys sp.]
MPRIIIVDDDKFVREATEILLRSRGYDVAVAPDGKTGIAMICDTPVDLAIIDLFMPDLNGISVIGIIREVKPNLPIIVASGFMLDQKSCPPMPGFEDMAAEAGVFRTLYKPLRPKDVISAVTDALASRGTPAATSRRGQLAG